MRRFTWVVVFMYALFHACGGGPMDEGDSAVYPSVTRLGAIANAPLAFAAESADRSGSRLTCPPGVQCVTPLDLEGRVYAASLMVGGDGIAPGYAITTVGATAEVRRRPDLGKDGQLVFSLSRDTDFSGDYVCCGGSPYPPDESAVVRRLEFKFDYLDATFVVPDQAGTALAGDTATIRLVFVSNTQVDDLRGSRADTVWRGDKLIRMAADDGFAWCADTSCNESARPSSPVTQADLRDRSGGANPNYVLFAVPLTNDNSITLTETEALEGGWLFTVQFDLGGALRFDVADWSTVTTPRELVEAFGLFQEYGQGAVVTLTKEKM